MKEIGLSSEISRILLKLFNNLYFQITVEGRYIFHCLSCSIGNVQLKSKLHIQRGSFFIVADPPKIAWTTSYVSDCLLSGKKQRLHITLLNGPGYIKEGSILKITSKSGLQFFSLNHCAIEIYPLIRDGLAREAFLSVTTAEADTGLSEAFLALPACEPFERVNVYYDVLAPIKRKLENESALTQHEVEFCVSANGIRIFKFNSIGTGVIYEIC